MIRVSKISVAWGLTAIGMLLASAGGHAQDISRPVGETQPLVILIAEGRTVPAQALFGEGKAASSVVSYRLSGGARLFEGDGKASIGTLRAGPITLPALAATTAGDEGYLTLVINGQTVARQIRVATVSEAQLTEARELVDLPSGPGAARSVPLLSPANTSAALRVEAGYLILDGAKLDRSRWSDAGTNVNIGGSVASGNREQALAFPCIRTPFGPGWIEWQGINPGAYLYSVLPEAGPPLVWAWAPSQSADAVYNRYWGCYNAIKIPDHCTFYAVDGGCCCNVAASTVFGICRWADFSGPEAGWPTCPL